MARTGRAFPIQGRYTRTLGHLGASFLKSISSSVTPIASTVRITTKKVVGSVTTISGVLDALKQHLNFQTVSGTISSIVGSMIRQTDKNPSGSIASAATLKKRVGRMLSGSVASAGAFLRLFPVHLTGVITFIQGNLVRGSVLFRSVSGTISMSGAVGHNLHIITTQILLVVSKATKVVISSRLGNIILGNQETKVRGK
jgi:hypothetical protein